MITVFYSCQGCGFVDRPVIVPERFEADPNQDVIKWVQDVAEVIGTDHSMYFPRCKNREMANLKIPLPKDDGGRVGQK